MNPEVKLAYKGLTYVGAVVLIGLVVLTNFFFNMADNALAGGSKKYAPHYPAVPAADITQAAQCKDAYASKWVGCNRLAQ